MWNISPEDHKAAIRHEYFARFGIVLLSLCFGAIVFGCAFLLPSLVLSRSRENAALLQQKELREKISKGETENPATQLKDLQEKLNALRSQSNVEISSVFPKVVAAKTPDIVITALVFSGSEATLKVIGKAKTRNSLVDFSKKLRLEKSFSGIDVPVSDLVKDKDIEFTINIKITM
jgi:hypothetical protein